MPVPPTGRYTYYPGTSEVPEQLGANTHNVSFKILAEVEFTGQSQGVIVAQGSRFGGYSLFVKDGKLTYVFNFLGIPPEQRVRPRRPGRAGTSSGSSSSRSAVGDHDEPIGTVKLYVDE